MENNLTNSANLEAIKKIAERLKEAQDKQQTIEFTFRVNMRKGKIERLEWFTEMVINFEV